MEQLTPRALRRLHLEERIAIGGTTGKIAQRELHAMDKEDLEGVEEWEQSTTGKSESDPLK